MNYGIFYSWQTDTPSKENRHFIRAALENAISKLQEAPEVVDAPRVESGMEGVSGTPEVATVMFEKIMESSLFLGDVSLTGLATRTDEAKRRMPNSNVILEMGFAAGTLGWDRVICVMNEAFGKREEQPFDVRNRRFPINYNLPADATAEMRKQALDRLTEDIHGALVGAEQCELLKVDRALRLLDLNCLHLLFGYSEAAYFSEPDEPSKEHVRGLFSKAIPRLLDLRLIETRQQFPLYAYHWTYLGKKVIAKLIAGSNLDKMLQDAKARGEEIIIHPIK